MASKGDYQQSTAKTIKAPAYQTILKQDIADYLVMQDDSPEREEDEGGYLEPRQTKTTRVGEPPRTEVQTGHGEAETLTNSEDSDVEEYLTTRPGECRRPGEHRRPLPSVPSESYEQIEMYDVIQDTHTGAGESPSLALPPPTRTNSRSRAGKKRMVIVAAVTTALVVIISTVLVMYFFMPWDSKPDHEPPHVEIHPSATTFIPPGGSGLFGCRVIGGVPHPELSWARANNEQFTANTLHEGQGNLRFITVTGDEQGTYICTASNVAGSVNATATLIIQDHEPPRVEIHPSATTFITPGDSGLFGCRVIEGVPPPEISWARANNEQFTANTLHEGQGNLRFISVTGDEQGTYICSASNVAGSVNATATLIIQDHEPPRVEIHPSATTVISPGGNGFLRCLVIGGVPPPETSWARAYNEQFTANTVHEGQGNLRFISVTGDEQGTYICTASNVAGSVTATATLTIRGAPDYSQVSHVKDYTNRGYGQYKLLWPSCIIVTQNDHIWVCDYKYNDKILILDNQLQPVSEIEADGQGPWYATASSGLIYITMRDKHQIYVYDENRTLLSVLGSQGSGLGQFNNPWGITSVGNKVYICDRDNNRIQVYENGTWSQFGQGELGRGPLFIAVSSSESRLAVVDLDKNLYILNRSHHVTHKFNKEQPPLNIEPRGVTYDLDNNLIVSDWVGDSLVVLDQDYNIISRIGGQELSRPWAVAWTRSGNLLVTDGAQDAVHLFRVPYRSRP